MPQFAASLSWLFQEAPLRERFALAAAAGFRAVEIQAPYEEPADVLAAARARAGVEVVLLNVQPAVAAIPGREDEFRSGLERALAYAQALGGRQLHCLAGQTGHPDAEATFVRNLRYAAAEAGARGVRVVIEPLNTTDNPGYFLTGTRQARRVIEAVASPHLGMQFDAYHVQIMEGSLTRSLREHRDVIAHIQVSGVPGRHEPDERQELNYPYLFGLIDELGYDGWVGCEYAPRAGTLEGLGWARPYGIGRTPGTIAT